MSWANKATHDYNVSLGNVLRVELVRLLRYIAASDRSDTVSKRDDMLLNYSTIIYLELIQLCFY